MKIEIKKAAINDLNEITQLYDSLLDELEKSINYPGWKRGIYPTVQDALKGIEENNIYIAKSGNKIAGSIILNHNPELNYDKVPWQIKADYKNIFVIHTFVVNPLFFRHGVGEKLMLFAEELAREFEIKAIRLDVYENNIPAIKLYEKCGYNYLGKIDLGLSHYGLDRFCIYEKII